jgi:hypothetical protein
LSSEPSRRRRRRGATDGLTNEEMAQCYSDHLQECQELLQPFWLEDCHSQMEMEPQLTVCTFELCGHATEELKTAGKTIMLLEFIENCKDLSVPLDPSHELFCNWPLLSGLGPDCADQNAVFNPCARMCSTLDCFDNRENSCVGTEPFNDVCECEMGYILNDGFGLNIFVKTNNECTIKAI